MKKAAFFLILLPIVITSCSITRLPDLSLVTPLATASRTPIAIGNCPVTLTEDKFSITGPVAGKSPVWITSPGEMHWSTLIPSASPYPGGIGRLLVFVETDVTGDLEITGNQIDGNALLWFPSWANESVNADEHNAVLVTNPVQTLIIRNPLTPEALPNPEGFVHHILMVYYPNPGCYELSAKIAGNVVKIVFNLVDQ